MAGSGCTCPADGSSYCAQCQRYAQQAGLAPLRVPRALAPFPLPPSAVTREQDLLLRVRHLALANGWLFYHTHDSRRSDAGYPDCTLAKPGRLVLAELKERTGKLSQAQAVWLDVLQKSVPSIEVYVWRPADWPRIVEVLTREAPPLSLP